MQRTLALVVFFFLFKMRTSRSMLCGTCEPSSCEEPKCPSGVTLDACKCCHECAKVEGEACGGENLSQGKCAEGLVCMIKPKSGSQLSTEEVGTCTVQKSLEKKEENEEDEEEDGILRVGPKAKETVVDNLCASINCEELVRPKDENFCPNDSFLKKENKSPTNQKIIKRCCSHYHPSTQLSSYKTLMMIFCQCLSCPQLKPSNPINCLPHQLPLLVSNGNQKPSTCCDVYKCADKEEVCKTILCNDEGNEKESETCPEDSVEIPTVFPLDTCCSKRKDCQCKPESQCLDWNMTCPEGFLKRIIKPKTNVPGSCCNVYDCVNVTLVAASSCSNKGQLKKNGDRWLEDCNTCECNKGVVICNEVECPHNSFKCDWGGVEGNDSCCPICKGCVDDNGNFYVNGEYWRPSSCVQCKCESGQKYCQAESCNVKCLNSKEIPGDCCPVCEEDILSGPEGCPLVHCELKCSKGYQNNESGCPLCECKDKEERGRHKNDGIEVAYDDDEDEINGDEEYEDGNDEDYGEDEYYHIDEKQDFKKESCHLKCPNGFLVDPSTGKKLCECAIDSNGNLKSSNSNNNNMILHNKNPLFNQPPHCPLLKDCHKQCLYGLDRDERGCLLCNCSVCPPLDCKKKCPLGFQLNTHNCPICKCKSHLPGPSRHQTNSLFSFHPHNSLSFQHRVGLDSVMLHNIGRHCVSANNRTMTDGQAWSDGCRKCFCHHGYEMCELVTCPPVRCSSPVMLPYGCCLTCPGTATPSMLESPGMCLSGDGRYYVEGETWSLDECTLCICHMGSSMCSIETCAPLLCHHPVVLPGNCCPICPGSSDYLSSSLISGSSMALARNRSCSSATGATASHGDRWRASSCQSCVCLDGVIHCFSQTCPILGCNKTVLKKGHCCPTCIDETVQFCSYNKETYDNGESWMVDDCTTCACMDGHVLCTMSICEPTLCKNPLSIPGKCCPVCQEPPCSLPSPRIDSNHPLNVTLILILISIIALLALAIIVLLGMLLWLRPQLNRHLRRPSSLPSMNPLNFFNSRKDHLPLNDEKSVSSSLLPLNSTPHSVIVNNSTTPINKNRKGPEMKYMQPPSVQTTPKMRLSVDDRTFDVPTLSAAVSSMTTASLASSTSSSATKKRLSSLDGCSGSDEKGVNLETSKEEIRSNNLSSTNLPPLPPRRRPPLPSETTHLYDVTVSVNNELFDSEKSINKEVMDISDISKSCYDNHNESSFDVPQGQEKYQKEEEQKRNNRFSEHFDSEEPCHLLETSPTNLQNNQNINNRKSW